MMVNINRVENVFKSFSCTANRVENTNNLTVPFDFFSRSLHNFL